MMSLSGKWISSQIPEGMVGVANIRCIGLVRWITLTGYLFVIFLIALRSFKLFGSTRVNLAPTLFRGTWDKFPPEGGVM
jgi:hypothetical protein